MLIFADFQEVSFRLENRRTKTHVGRSKPTERFQLGENQSLAGWLDVVAKKRRSSRRTASIVGNFLRRRTSTRINLCLAGNDYYDYDDYGRTRTTTAP